MSKVQKWQFNDLFESRRDKLINLLFTEIIFLKKKSKFVLNENGKDCIQIALNKLDFLLNALKNYEHQLNDYDFDKIILIIYKIFKETIQKLEE